MYSRLCEASEIAEDPFKAKPIWQKPPPPPSAPVTWPGNVLDSYKQVIRRLHSRQLSGFNVNSSCRGRSQIKASFVFWALAENLPIIRRRPGWRLLVPFGRGRISLVLWRGSDSAWLSLWQNAGIFLLHIPGPWSMAWLNLASADPGDQVLDRFFVLSCGVSSLEQSVCRLQGLSVGGPML